MDSTIGFGRFKNISFSSLAKTEPRYFIWLYKQDWLNKAARTALERNIDDVILNFGKHDGNSIGDIKKLDSQYVRWLLERPTQKSNVSKQTSSIEL